MDLKSNFLGMGIYLLVGIPTLLIILYADAKKRKAAQSLSRSAKRKKLLTIGQYMWVYNTLDNFFLTRNGLRKIRNKLGELSVYNAVDLVTNTVEYYATSKGFAIVVLIIAIVLTKDLFMTLLLLFFAIVVEDTVINKRLDAVHFRIKVELLEINSSLQEGFLKTHDIVDAISDVPSSPLLSRAVTSIYNILTAPNSEGKLEEFNASTPFHLLQTLAGTCQLLNDVGDAKLSDGTTLFVHAMTLIAEDIRIDIRGVKLRKSTFGFLEWLPVIYLAGIPIIENWLSDIIPATSIVYKGPIGYISKVVIVLASTIAYLTITRMNSSQTIKRDDRPPLFRKMLEFKPWLRFVKTIVPKDHKKRGEIYGRFRNSMSQLTLNLYYTGKVVYSTLLLFLSIVVLVFATSIGKSFIYENVNNLSLVSGNELTAEELAKRKVMDAYYLELEPAPKSDAPDDNITENIIRKYIPEVSDFDMGDQVDRLQKKYSSYYNAYFHWWMLLVCYAIAVIGWFVPDILLFMRRKVIKSDAVEDVLQLQTMLAVIMHTPLDTMDTVLWLARQSRIHRDVLVECYHNYASDPEMSLYKLRDSSSLPEFRRIVDKLLLTVHQASLPEAFNDLVAERHHVLEQRTLAQQAAMKSRRQLVSPLSLLPAGLLVALMLIVPLLSVGFSSFISGYGEL